MKFIALDLEARGLKPYGQTVWMLSITRPNGKKYKTELLEDCNGLKRLPASIKKEIEDKSICKVLHNALYDGPILQLIFGCKLYNIWDTMNMEAVIQGVQVSFKKKSLSPAEEKLMLKHSIRLEYVLPRYGYKRPDKNLRDQFIDRPFGVKFSTELKEYAIGDTDKLLQIQKAQEFLLHRENLIDVALLENVLTERLIRQRSLGIRLDVKLWGEIAEANEKEFNRRMAKLPKGINWNSPAQVKKFFMQKGIAISGYSELEDVYLATGNKMLGDFIYARELHKAVTSYGKNWFAEGFVDGDGRIRSSINQIINTGRMSMSEPNLHQLPGEGNVDPKHKRVIELVTGGKNNKLKWRHREAFIPAVGCRFVIGDFSGQEIGVMAAASGEKLWINALLRGDDVHGLTASMIDASDWKAGTLKGCKFPKKCECPVHKGLRKNAKINNFMMAYGGGADRLAENTGMNKLQARAYVGAHRRALPRLTNYLEKNGRKALETGVAYSASPYKRRRVLRAEENWQIINQGKNTPIQAAGADMLKLAIISLPESLPMVVNIHDEIVLEVPAKQAKQAAKILKQVMEQAADYVTGIKGLIKVEPRIQTNLMKED